MTSIRHTISLSALACAGLAAWLAAGHALARRQELDGPLNVLGIHRSPYGEVLALAVQAPIDETFQGGYLGAIGSAASRPTATHAAQQMAVRGLSGFLQELDHASHINTSAKRVSPQHRFYLRRKAENQLRFAYNLDPSQYSNYNSLHFFLTEPAIGTRGSLTPAASALAWETIHYCLSQEDDPRPPLTAAAACTNLLQLMFADHRTGIPRHTTQDMREVLATLDMCLTRYHTIARQWDATGNWNLLSPQRIQECQERYDFIVKIRNASEKTIRQYENSQPPHPPAAGPAIDP
jgi:hypothetical protein